MDSQCFYGRLTCMLFVNARACVWDAVSNYDQNWNRLSLAVTAIRGWSSAIHGRWQEVHVHGQNEFICALFDAMGGLIEVCSNWAGMIVQKLLMFRMGGLSYSLLLYTMFFVLSINHRIFWLAYQWYLIVLSYVHMVLQTDPIFTNIFRDWTADCIHSAIFHPYSADCHCWQCHREHSCWMLGLRLARTRSQSINLSLYWTKLENKEIETILVNALARERERSRVSEYSYDKYYNMTK